MPKQKSQPESGLEIPQDEQWRLINSTGVLKQAIPRQTATPATAGSEKGISLTDEIFNATLLITPFSFLLIMMEMCVVFQFHSSGFVTYTQNRQIVWSTINMEDILLFERWWTGQWLASLVCLSRIHQSLVWPPSSFIHFHILLCVHSGFLARQRS